jgi:hypothetical protein
MEDDWSYISPRRQESDIFFNRALVDAGYEEEMDEECVNRLGFDKWWQPLMGVEVVSPLTITSMEANRASVIKVMQQIDLYASSIIVSHHGSAKRVASIDKSMLKTLTLSQFHGMILNFYGAVTSLSAFIDGWRPTYSDYTNEYMRQCLEEWLQIKDEISFYTLVD